MDREIPKTYSPSEIEDRWYKSWLDKKLFEAHVNKQKKPYTVVIPPPNITGILTMGHVLNNSIQDVFVRWKRMKGFEACWVPGTDHAGIATQNVVEKSLAKEGKDRHSLGREKFIDLVWKWREQYGGKIIKQLKKLGVSCDWSRERFTMDDGLSQAVGEVFVRLYQKGLIYRGKYIVNWCPKDHTAISDDEVEYQEKNGKLYYIKYPFEDGSGHLTVATTRPETMLGDVAVAVNPSDERFKNLIGKKLVLPLVGRKMKIIADDYVDKEFGTGAVKITPAHDPNDFMVAGRHGLEKIAVLDISGKVNENAPEKYRGLDRFKARKLIIEDLEALQLVDKITDYKLSVGECYRCHTVIEPYLSDQWFVKMKPLAEPALKAVRDGKIHFYPERWVKTYENWLENIRDWCISRQLWWGHRIPVWYCSKCGEQVVSTNAPASPCSRCGGESYHQDEDVLDTWFSSWLWPFSLFGWPEETPDLKYFYPTDTLVTAPDIIFFWVARMIIAGIEFRGDVPFRDVYFTSVIRDMQGRKMSKSLGNSPDPLDVIRDYGADALRFTILYLAPLGQDVLFEGSKCEMGRNFANKIWNAGRFLMMNQDKIEVSAAPDNSIFDFADKWIVSRLHRTIRDLNISLDHFRINDAAKIIYDFVWHDYCDWYVEMVKERLNQVSNEMTRAIILANAISIFESAIKLLHPFMPFITEELYGLIKEGHGSESITVAEFPEAEIRFVNEKIEAEMELIQEVISSIRAMRKEASVPPNVLVDIVVKPKDENILKTLSSNESHIRCLAKAESFSIGFDLRKPETSKSAVIRGTEIFISLEGLVNVDAERSRLEKEIDRVKGVIAGIEAKLSNEQFIKRAPAQVIEKEKLKIESMKVTLAKLEENVSAIR
ncbi:MAG TPA: valine--tRNA ligase [Candidatus Acidoferrales bacterium]|nr:valine--tRNA ligase [Candidatus Acidoferrales bacterium]